MTSPIASAPGAVPLVLVRPFTATSADEAYLAEGVSDELAIALAQLPGLRVISRGTSVNLRDEQLDARQAAALVGATLVVTGRARQAAGRLEVHLELTTGRDVSDPTPLDVELPMSDFTGVVQRLATHVLATCAVPPPPHWGARVARRISDTPEALDLVLRGRFHMEQRPIGVKLAMQCFDRAIRLDGAVADAHGALALLWANFGIFLALPPQQAAERAREQALRALSVDALDPLARTALLTVATFYDWDLEGADALGDDLLAQYPSMVAPRQVLLYAHAARADMPAVRAVGREVQVLDPRAVDPVNDYAFALLLCGAAREAAALLDAHAALHPSASEVWRRLGLARLEAGDAEQAVHHLERSVALSRRHAWGVANLACARARAGDTPGGRALLTELLERAEGELVPDVAIAEIHASLGAHDAAFASLTRALEARDYWLLALDVDPLLAPLRSDPRFAAVRARRLPPPTA